MNLPWLVCYQAEDGRLLRCYACAKEWEARVGAAYLNRCKSAEHLTQNGEGKFTVVRR